MAPSLSFMSSTLIHGHSKHNTQVSTISSAIQMPNVFVVPPEEDDIPTWCCFDGVQLLERDCPTFPNLDILETALSVIQSSESCPPIFRRDSGLTDGTSAVPMPLRNERRSTPEVLINDDQNQVLPSLQGKEPGNDSEIVEVVKVGRSESQYPIDSASHMKRPRTLRSRASKAFRSIKNVGKSSKSHVKDTVVSSGTTQATVMSHHTQTQGKDEPPLRPARPRRSSSQFFSRRGSVILSQIFDPPKLNTSPSFDDSSPSAVPSEPLSSSSSIRSSPYAHTTHTYTSPFLPDYDHDPEHDNDSLSTQTFPSSRRRLSMLSLHRLFSFNSNTSNDPSPTPMSTPSLSSGSSGPSSSSSVLASDTPMPHVYPSSVPSLRFDELEENQKIEAAVGAAENRLPSIASPSIGTMDIEMRLDSLHFDSISFDVDNF